MTNDKSPEDFDSPFDDNESLFQDDFSSEENTEDFFETGELSTSKDDTLKGFDDENSQENPPSPSEDHSLEKIDVSAISIRIDLELARVRVSLSELQKMAPGQKIPVAMNPRIVNLVVGNKTIGRGEVVEIGESTCIKVLELYNQ